VSCLPFGLGRVLLARQMALFNPVFVGLAGGQMACMDSVVAMAVAGLVLC